MVYNKHFAKQEQTGILKSYRALTKISNSVIFLLQTNTLLLNKYKWYILVLQNAIFLMEEETVLHVSDSLKRPTIKMIDKCYYMCNAKLFN